MPKHDCSKLPKCISARNALAPLTKSGDTIISLYNNRYIRCERLNFEQHNWIFFTCIENISESENTCFKMLLLMDAYISIDQTI